MPPRESPDTIRDLLQGFNSFQMQLGLMPGQGGGGYAGIQTPPMKHPGQVAQEMSMQVAQQALQTMQSAHATRQMVAPNALPMTAMAAVSAPPLPPSIGQFGQDFGQRMQSIQQQYLSPWAAQGLSGMTGQSGFGNMPSPVMMTPPHMGIYRPPMGPPPSPFLARERPMFPTPMTPMHPPPMFQTPFEQRYQEGVTADETVFGVGVAGAGTAGRVATGFGAMAAGGAMGRGLMGRIGLPQFGKLGRMGGMIGGAALGFGALGGLAEQGVAGLLEPSVQARTLGQQLEVASRNFVVSGPQLSELGRGLSTRAAVGSTNRMQDMIQGGQIQGFNIRDMTRMTAQAGSMGMLDMAQSGEQIAQTMKNLARNLQVFMRLAQEPDVTRAMQQMASMRSMGLTIPETTMAMQNAYQFAKQSGTSMKGLMQTAGLPGAMTFQQLGMTAGLGMQVGMGARGMAQQAIAGGAYTPGQLAMAGGASGIGQSLTEAAGATLGVNFQTMAMMTRNAQGNLAIDSGKLRGLMSGKYNLQQQAEMGADNVARLGGERAITEMHSRVNELRDQMGRSLGPQGSAMLLIRQALNTQQALGGPNVMALGGALQMIAPNMSQNQIRSMELMARSPQFWRNMERWQEQRIGEFREMESRRREAVVSESGISGALRRAVGTPVEDAMSHVGAARRSISQWLTTRERRARAVERGETHVDTEEDNTWRGVAGGAEAERRTRAFVAGGGFQRQLQRQQGELRRNRAEVDQFNPMKMGGRDSAVYNTLNQGGMFGVLPRTFENEESGALAQAQAGVGTGGAFDTWVARNAPNLFMALAGGRVTEAQSRAGDRAGQVYRAGATVQRAISMGSSDADRLITQNRRVLGDVLRKAGKGEPNALQMRINKKIEALYKSKAAKFGSDANVGDNETRRAIQEAASEHGLSGSQAAELANGPYRNALVAEAARLAHQRGDPETRGALVNAMENKNTLERTGAGSFKGDLESWRKTQETTEAMSGLTADVEVGGFFGISVRRFSTEEKETMRNIIVNTDDPLKLLASSEVALRKAGKTDEADRVRAQIEKAAGGDAKRLSAAYAFGDVQGRGENARMYKSLGKAMAGQPDAVAAMTVLQRRTATDRAGKDVTTGAAVLYKAGATAFKDFATTDFANEGRMEGKLTEFLGSTEQRRAAGKAITDASEAYMKTKAGSKERTEAAGKLQVAMMDRGGGRAGVSFGGKGAGSAGEDEAKDTMENIRSMAKQAMDQGGVGAEAALAAAIPTFAEGAIALKEAAASMKQTSDEQRLDGRMKK